jgi:hypothetical protein
VGLFLCVFVGAAAPTVASQELTGGLEGTFVVETRAGASVVPADPKVWILYGPSPACRPGNNCKTDLAADRFMDEEFACRQKLSKQTDPIEAALRNLKHPQNDLEVQRKEQLSGQLNSYYTRCGDAAIAKTMAWADKHPKDSWQAREVRADPTGRWAASGLKNGDHILVFRATLDKFEVYSLNEEPPAVMAGQTITVSQLPPLLSPRTVAH